MPKHFLRSDRYAEELHKVLALALQMELKDPRLSQVIISRVEVTKDLGYAKIFFNCLTEDATAEDALTLNKASGFFRSLVAKRLKKARTVPRLLFEVDKAYLEGQQVYQAIHKLDIQPASDEEDSDS